MNLSKPSSSSSAADAPGLLYAGFNQDFGCFATGLDSGFRIYNCDPLKEKMRKDFEDGGISIVEMLFRCNYLALVGGGKNPKYPPNKVIIWDDLKSKGIVELEFRSEVKNVKLRRDRIVVVLANKVFVYVFSANPLKLHTFETIDNDKGNMSNTGKIKNSNSINSSGSTTVMTTNVSIIPAHSGKLSCLSVNSDGSKCASASEKGTLIRVFDTSSGKLLNELRRGVDRAEIYSIAFDQSSTRLCVSSDKGTVHIFNLDAILGNGASHSPNNGSYYAEKVINFSFMKDLLPKYFSSEWSFAHFKVIADCRCICGFGQEVNTIIVICADGSCYKFLFDPRKGGECVREHYTRFLKDLDE
ncbi:Hsv2p [Rhizophagus irregularis DAOM 197198w]|uniref:Hsv2p n=1 Tax=Rhizophagus irregularis (strain DAOM 197198w) TaxID=1432141 RepID=A0A015LBT9_RHIIW|nr:Hsv2p [Rhizophagus irregularis DAOM 197198w]